MRQYPNGTRTEVTLESRPGGVSTKLYETTFARPQGKLGYRHKKTWIAHRPPSASGGHPIEERSEWVRRSPGDEAYGVLSSRRLYRDGRLFVERSFFGPGDQAPGVRIQPTMSWSFHRSADGELQIGRYGAPIRQAPAGIQGWSELSSGHVSVSTVRSPDGTLKKYDRWMVAPMPGAQVAGARLLYRQVYRRSGNTFTQVHTGWKADAPGQSSQYFDAPASLGIKVTHDLPRGLRPGSDLTTVDAPLPAHHR